MLCGVLIDGFPSIHSGSPWALSGAMLVLLYLMQWWLPVHTNYGGAVEEGQGWQERRGGKRTGQEMIKEKKVLRKGTMEMEKMDVQKETRSGERLEGQLYQARRDNAGLYVWVSTFLSLYFTSALDIIYYTELWKHVRKDSIYKIDTFFQR